MELKGLNVLVDGYNLELIEGTGIKTYGLSLIKALKLLGLQVTILSSWAGAKSNNAILKEILFFDNQRSNNFNKNTRFILFNKMIKDSVKMITGIPYRADKIVMNKNLVIKKGFFYNFIESGEIFNLPLCYKTTNIRYRIFGVRTTITVPHKIDVWHATHPLPIKIRKTNKITTIHDLIPLKLPYTTLDDKRLFYKNIKDSVKDSAIIITVSENTKKDLLSICDISPDRVCVTYQPIAIDSILPEKEDIVRFLKTYKLKFRNYILFVGTIEPKKNVGRLIDAYSMLGTDMPLVLVGKKGWLWEKELRKNLENIYLLEYIPAEYLKYLYAGAYYFVFPSLYEGFGLPPLEAMTFGCPVITSNTSSLPEVCGNAALYVDPYDVDDIRQKMESLLSSPQMRDSLSKAGKERAKLFSMENYVKKLYEAYSKAL